MLNFIVNPIAGDGISLKVAERAKELLSGVDCAFYFTKHRKHATEIAFNLIKQGERDLVCCGGDGTINEIINGIALSGQKDVRLGFLPGGTGNDFLRSAGLFLAVEEAVEVILAGNTHNVDVIDVNGIKTICFSCSGVDAEVVKMCNAEKHKSKMSYIKNLLKSLGNEYSFKLTTENGTKEFTGSIISVLNGSSIATGVNYCPMAKVDDGLMDVVVIKTAKRLPFIRCFASALRSKILQNKHVYHEQCKYAEIESSLPVLDIDGELYFGLSYKATVLPEFLTIFC